MIETQHLVIEEAKLTDQAFFYELMNSPGWLKYIGDRGIQNTADAASYIQNSLIASYHTNGFGLYKVSMKTTGTPIGICGFLKRDYLVAPDLGFALLPAYAGQGYMYEAASMLLQQAPTTLGFTQVYAITLPGNERSLKLLHKLGFAQKELIQRDNETLVLLEKLF